MPSYDFPFNERIRTLLRLEDLFQKAFHHVDANHEHSHHCALLTLFQIMDVIDRAELKMDLLQELDRQKIGLNVLRGKPGIAEAILNETISRIEAAGAELRANTGKLGQALRDNEWLMSIKQRAGIPGGVCEFDVPSYHYWLGLGAERRTQDLRQWLKFLMPISNALNVILHILRGSGSSSSFIAPQGAYQQMLGGTKPAQMLRVELGDQQPYFPEVSANKYAINIRFHSLELNEKPRPVETDVNFTLILCNL
ncbi:cell division protein ZapD [Methylobacillus flagellatus]|uniref:cell division protein ZapD n=1 Tax=Methylobacillus flagellatus TaxID=405 RepID=UPI0010F45609|nr:cell division protein ZapD [Methylobacillus flagellatus]